MSAAAPPAPGALHRHLSFLGFDYGTRRVGVASGNTLLHAATPLATIDATGDARWAAIGRLVAEHRPDALVIGVPFHPDGAPHDNTHRARAFGRQLHGRFRLPVHEVDERYSTVEALHEMGRGGAAAPGGGRRADADAVAAAIILEQYLRGLPPVDLRGEAPGEPETYPVDPPPR